MPSSWRSARLRDSGSTMNDKHESAKDFAAELSELFDCTSNHVERLVPLIEADRAAIAQQERDEAGAFTRQDMLDFCRWMGVWPFDTSLTNFLEEQKKK